MTNSFIIGIVVVVVLLLVSGALLMGHKSTPPVVAPKTVVITGANNMFAYYHRNAKLFSTPIPTGTYTYSQLADNITVALVSTEPGWNVTFDDSRKVFIVTNNNFQWDRCEVQNHVFGTMQMAPAGCGTSWKNTEMSNQFL